MNVIFKHSVIIFKEGIAEIVIDFINHILYASNEKELRQIVADFTENSDLNKYFAYGYGDNHLWLKQRKLSDPEKTFDYRILIVTF